MFIIKSTLIVGLIIHSDYKHLTWRTKQRAHGYQSTSKVIMKLGPVVTNNFVKTLWRLMLVFNNDNNVIIQL